MRWNEFRSVCPELADIGQRRLEERHLCLIGTLRRDGWPRISPVEPYLVDGELMMGMMPGSRKAADLLRDPRLVVHSIVTRWEADEGDFFLLKLERHGTLFHHELFHHEWLGSETGRESCRSRGSTYLFLPWLVLGSGRLSTGIWHGSAKPWPGHHDAGRTGRH